MTEAGPATRYRDFHDAEANDRDNVADFPSPSVSKACGTKDTVVSSEVASSISLNLSFVSSISFSSTLPNRPLVTLYLPLFLFPFCDPRTASFLPASCSNFLSPFLCLVASSFTLTRTRRHQPRPFSTSKQTNRQISRATSWPVAILQIAPTREISARRRRRCSLWLTASVFPWILRVHAAVFANACGDKSTFVDRRVALANELQRSGSLFSFEISPLIFGSEVSRSAVLVACVEYPTHDFGSSESRLYFYLFIVLLETSIVKEIIDRQGLNLPRNWPL